MDERDRWTRLGALVAGRKRRARPRRGLALIARLAATVDPTATPSRALGTTLLVLVAEGALLGHALWLVRSPLVPIAWWALLLGGPALFGAAFASLAAAPRGRPCPHRLPPSALRRGDIAPALTLLSALARPPGRALPASLILGPSGHYLECLLRALHALGLVRAEPDDAASALAPIENATLTPEGAALVGAPSTPTHPIAPPDLDLASSPHLQHPPLPSRWLATLTASLTLLLSASLLPRVAGTFAVMYAEVGVNLPASTEALVAIGSRPVALQAWTLANVAALVALAASARVPARICNAACSGALLGLAAGGELLVATLIAPLVCFTHGF